MVLLSSGFPLWFTQDWEYGVPIHEGYTLRHAILRLAGRDLSEFLVMNLTERGYSCTATAEREIVRDVMEKLCYMRVEYDTELKSTAEFEKKKTYVLPDGNIITVAPNVFRCAKVLFQPNFSGQGASGVHDNSFLFNMKCDADIRKNLYANVVLSSDTTIFQGIGEHMNEPTTCPHPQMRSRWLLYEGALFYVTGTG